MAPHELIAALVRDTKMPLLQVATAIDRASFQSTLHKLVHGQIASPTRSTAKKIADYFELPVEALYDSKLATQIAFERGIKAPAPVQAASYMGLLRELDSAAKGGQFQVNENAPEGPHRVTRLPAQAELLPALMVESIKRLTPHQRASLVQMIDAYLTGLDQSYASTKAASS